jgi:hypothetical protein
VDAEHVPERTEPSRVSVEFGLVPDAERADEIAPPLAVGSGPETPGPAVAPPPLRPRFEFVLISPHDASGPIKVLAGARVVMPVPACYRLETTRSRMDRYDASADTPLDVRDGHPTFRPGLGLD